jgi:phosphotriesterase-related protein
MSIISRRTFLGLVAGSAFVRWSRPPGKIVTVNGVIDSYRIGTTLVHEHVLVDFIGAAETGFHRWERNEVVQKVSPYFETARSHGVRTIVECTPAYLGRDVRLLKTLSDKTKMHLVTNTGYYGAVNNKYLPPWAFTESAEQLAARWTDDFEFGIDGTNIRPGFIKISVDADPKGLSDLHRKIVRAAALTHLKTGLVIYCHTGPAKAAFEEMEILKKEKVDPSALVWVHAQAEEDMEMYVLAAKSGAWVSLDNVSEKIEKYGDALSLLKKNRLLHRVLISHDAGYYRPGEKDGGEFTGYTAIFTHLLPSLLQKGFDKRDVRQLLELNPQQALELRVRKYSG